MVFPVVMYGCESWIIKKAEHPTTDACVFVSVVSVCLSIKMIIWFSLYSLLTCNGELHGLIFES